MKMVNKWLKFYALVISLVISLVFIVSACSGASNSSSTMDMEKSESYSRNDISTDAKMPQEAPPESAEQTYGESSRYTASDSAAPIEEKREEKRIKTANLTTETNDFENLINNIKAVASNEGGYVENYNSYIYTTTKENKDLKRGEIVIRIPSANYSSVLEQIKTLAKVNNISESEELASDRYYDIEARMKTIELEEERVLAMIDKAEELEDLILLEQRLSSIREKIELYQSQLNQIDRKSSFSTIMADITEVLGEVTIQPVSDDFMSKLGNSFKASINATLTFFENIMVVLAGAIVPVALLAAAGLICWFIVVKIRKRKEARKQQ